MEKVAYASVVALAWSVKELIKFITSKKKDNTPKEDLPASFKEVEKQFAAVQKSIYDSKLEQITAMRDLTSAINQLTMTLLRGK